MRSSELFITDPGCEACRRSSPAKSPAKFSASRCDIFQFVSPNQSSFTLTNELTELLVSQVQDHSSKNPSVKNICQGGINTLQLMVLFQGLAFLVDRQLD